MSPGQFRITLEIVSVRPQHPGADQKGENQIDEKTLPLIKHLFGNSPSCNAGKIRHYHPHLHRQANTGHPVELFRSNFQYVFDLETDFESITSARLTAYAYDDASMDWPIRREVFSVNVGTRLWPIFVSPLADMPDNSTRFGSWNVLPYIVDGSLNATLSAVWGDLYFDKFELTVTGTPPAAVPIPSAVWMLVRGWSGWWPSGAAIDKRPAARVVLGTRRLYRKRTTGGTDDGAAIFTPPDSCSPPRFCGT